MAKLKSKSKYKIAAITTIHNTMEWFVTPTMRHLSENGFDVSLIANMPEKFVEENKEYAKCISIDMTRGITNVFRIFKIIWEMYKLFRREKFDIIYYMSPNASFYASIAGFFARVKIRIYSQTGIRYVSLNGKKRKVFKLVEKITCKMSTDVKSQSRKNLEFAVSEKLCKRKKISVVGIGGTVGIDLKEYDLKYKDLYRNEIRQKYGIVNETFVFGFVGRVNKDKGVNELLLAYKALKTENLDIALILVGMLDYGNPVDQDLLAWAKENSSIIFTNHIAPEDVFKYMCAFDMLVHPTYREGFGKVLQEAMGAKLPIITTDIPGPSEVIEDGISGLLVEVKNVDVLKTKMLELMLDKKLLDSLAKEGRIRVEKYFDRNIMLKNIYDDIVNILKKNTG